MKPVGKPDALIGHVRFDERGWETGRRLSVSARAHPRLYLQSDWPDRSTLPNTRGLSRVIRTRAQNPNQFPVSDSFRRDVSARRFAVAGAKHLVENQSRRIKQAKDGRRDGLP